MLVAVLVLVLVPVLALVLTLASLSRLQRQITKRPCRTP